MPGFLTFILLGIPTLGLIVFVHELGHFIAARIVGVRVTQFSLGFGKRLTGFTRGDTDYRVALLPLGGYVKMAGDNIEEDRSGSPDEFLSRKWYERAFIAIAGPAANFVMAIACSILLFALGAEFPLQPNVVGPVEPGSVVDSLGLAGGERIGLVNDRPTPYWNDVIEVLDDARAGGLDAVLRLEAGGAERSVSVPNASIPSFASQLLPDVPAEVGQVTVGAPAYQAGLREGDLIVEIEGIPIGTWWDLRREVRARPDQPTLIRFEREGLEHERSVTPADQKGDGVIGITQRSYGTGVARYGPVESVSRGVEYTFAVTGGFIRGLGQLFGSPGKLGSNLAGPIAIVQMSADQAKRGRTDLLNWLIFVSIALMTMNLLPIPVLDGGHIVVAVIEGVTRRPLRPRFMIAIWRAGMVFLLLLMTFAIANDGLKLFKRSQADRLSAPVEAPTNAAPSGAGD